MSGIVALLALDGRPISEDNLRRVVEAGGARAARWSSWRDGPVALAELDLHKRPRLDAICAASHDQGDSCIVVVDGPTPRARVFAAARAALANDWRDGPLVAGATGEELALAAWDAASRRLVVQRDALGARPLCYGRAGKVLVCASEPRQVLAFPGVARDIDQVAIADHLVGYCWNEERTPFSAVRWLPPGHMLVVHLNDETVSLRRWWDPATDIESLRDPPSVLAARWRAAFTSAVAVRTPAQDEPIGMLLGGVDSGSVASAARHLGPRRRIVAASYRFDNEPEADERAWQIELATSLRLDTTAVSFSAHPLLGTGSVMPSLDGPFLAWTSADTALLAAIARGGATIAFSGHGGDLVAGGSPLSLAGRLRRADPTVLSDAHHDIERIRTGRGVVRWLYDHAMRPQVPAWGETIAHAWRRGRSSPPVPPWIAPRWAERTGLTAGHPPRPPAPLNFSDPAKQALYGALLHPGAVSRAASWLDRLAVSQGVTVRHPFMDARLATLALSMPPQNFYHAGERKRIHRTALRVYPGGHLFARQRKADFASVHDSAMRTPTAAQVIKALLEDPISARLGWTDAVGLRALHKHFTAAPGPRLGEALWAAVTLELWLTTNGAWLGIDP